MVTGQRLVTLVKTRTLVGRRAWRERDWTAGHSSDSAQDVNKREEREVRGRSLWRGAFYGGEYENAFIQGEH
jgi:hypothetical protein